MTDFDPGQLDEALSAFLDGELSDEETARIELILKENVEARQRLEALREVSGQLDALPRRHAPDELLENLMAHMERDMLLGADEDEPQVTHRKGSLISLLATAALVTIVVGGGLWIFTLVGDRANPSIHRSAQNTELKKTIEVLQTPAPDEADQPQEMEVPVSPSQLLEKSVPASEGNQPDRANHLPTRRKASREKSGGKGQQRQLRSEQEKAESTAAATAVEERDSFSFDGYVDKSLADDSEELGLEEEVAESPGILALIDAFMSLPRAEKDRSVDDKMQMREAASIQSDSGEAILIANYASAAVLPIVQSRLESDLLQMESVSGGTWTSDTDDSGKVIREWDVRIEPDQVDRLIDSLILPPEKFSGLHLDVGFLRADDRERIASLLTFARTRSLANSREAQPAVPGDNSTRRSGMAYPFVMSWDSFFPNWESYDLSFADECAAPLPDSRIHLRLRLEAERHQPSPQTGEKPDNKKGSESSPEPSEPSGQ